VDNIRIRYTTIKLKLESKKIICNFTQNKEKGGKPLNSSRINVTLYSCFKVELVNSCSFIEKFKRSIYRKYKTQYNKASELNKIILSKIHPLLSIEEIIIILLIFKAFFIKKSLPIIEKRQIHIPMLFSTKALTKTIGKSL
jgi:hypothetical protein